MILKTAGALAVGTGLLLAATLLAPIGEPGTNGLHRITLDERERLSYGTGSTFYLISTRAVMAAAAVFLISGSALALLGCRR